jgi:cytochrome P450
MSLQRCVIADLTRSEQVMTTTLAELEHPNSNTWDIDLGGAEFKANALRYLSEWASRPPMYVSNTAPTQVIVGRYSDVQEVFTDVSRFSSEVPRGKGYEQFDKFIGGMFLTQMDGERHARLRRLLMGAFSRKRLAQLEDRLSSIIESFLDDIERKGPEFDAVSQYAARLVVGALLTAMMNLGPDQQKVLLDFHETLTLVTRMKPGQEFPAEVRAAYDRLCEVVRELIADRRRAPRSDFLGDLVAARDQGDRLTDTELFDMIFGISGALATTPRSSAGALYLLYSHLDQLDQLVGDRSLIPDAVEECLRLAGNWYFTFPRIATCDTVLGGTEILKGMIVRPSPQAANYDATVFPNPLTFDIHRRPNRIMTFGAGPHHCIGSLLGRRTIQIAIERLLVRFPNARLADLAFVPSYGGQVGELRMKSLPMITH